MIMASEDKVKQYLAYWFQLGKKAILCPTGEVLLPEPIFVGSQYSPAFESCWQRLLTWPGDAYLEGTSQSIQQLLTPIWDIVACARCAMPVPVINAGISSPSCPCQDLPNWPNLELPRPHNPSDTQQHLSRIRQRLQQAEAAERENSP